MSGEPKDPAIKLFGKTIPLPEAPPEGAADSDCNGIQETTSLPDEDISRDQDDAEIDQEKVEQNPTSSKQVDGAQSLSTLEDSANPDAASGIDKEAKASKCEEEESETSNSQDKPLKKPDKILPCPRCNSMETKFCYYNNYNVNQPRHFCKNCQRYWTAGGTMRNVPVGAGRRKNKSSTSHYRHITVSEALQNARIDAPNGVVKPNGAVLAFGSDAPLCESMASALSLADKNMRNGYPKPDGLMVQVPTGDIMPSNEVLNGKNGPATVAYPPQVQYPGMPWPYLPIGPPPFCPPPGFAMPLYPAYYCGVPCAWPWVPGPVSPSQTSTSSNPNSPTLGKHSREEIALKPSGSPEDESLKEGNSEKSLWVPKTLRIDDPEDAAKSSIWATLGIKKDSPDLASKAGLFRGFRTKGDVANCVADASHMLQANPAAMSRSLNFNENS